MALEFFGSDSIVNYRLLLSEQDSLNEILGFFHEAVREQRAVNAVAAPTPNSITHSNSNVCDKASVFTRFCLILRNRVTFSNENKNLVVGGDVGRAKVMAWCDS